MAPQSFANQFSPLAAVHFADYCHTSLEPFRAHEAITLDNRLQEVCVPSVEEPQYRAACEELFHSAKNSISNEQRGR